MNAVVSLQVPCNRASAVLGYANGALCKRLLGSAELPPAAGGVSQTGYSYQGNVAAPVLGFDERILGSHHIYSRAGVEEILNLQPRGSLAKPYQVRQVRQVILKYKLAEEEQ